LKSTLHNWKYGLWSRVSQKYRKQAVQINKDRKPGIPKSFLHGLDPLRKAILLTAGDKTGISQKRFYKTLIAKADDRYDVHLNALKG